MKKERGGEEGGEEGVVSSYFKNILLLPEKKKEKKNPRIREYPFFGKKRERQPKGDGPRTSQIYCPTCPKTLPAPPGIRSRKNEKKKKKKNDKTHYTP